MQFNTSANSSEFWNVHELGLTISLCVEIEFYADISEESRCNSEIEVWAHFYNILIFL